MPSVEFTIRAIAAIKEVGERLRYKAIELGQSIKKADIQLAPIQVNIKLVNRRKDTLKFLTNEIRNFRLVIRKVEEVAPPDSCQSLNVAVCKYLLEQEDLIKKWARLFQTIGELYLALFYDSWEFRSKNPSVVQALADLSETSTHLKILTHPALQNFRSAGETPQTESFPNGLNLRPKNRFFGY